MRPEYIELTGWGPYAHTAKVDFKKVEEHGIFLITGPTGAGKTTIFDGIAFALFGEVSGSMRQKDSLRSDFSDVDTKTKVFLRFSHRKTEYEIMRTPRYERRKKRGDGTVVQNETAELKKEGELLCSGPREVTEEVKKILSLNYEQFRQISMIAQGEFQKLLVSNGKERTQIFRNIFKTDLYEKLQISVGARAKKLSDQNAEIQLRLKEIASSLYIEEESALDRILKEEVFSFEQVLEVGWESMRREEEKFQKIKQTLDMLEEKIRKVTWNLSEKDRIFKLKQNLEQAQKEYEALKEQKAEWEVQQKEIEKEQNRLEELKQKEKEIERECQKRKEYETLCIQVKRQEGRWEEEKARLDKWSDQIESERIRQEEAKKKYLLFQKLGEEERELSLEHARLHTILSSVEQILQKKEQLKKQHEELIAAQKDYQIQEAIYQKERADWEAFEEEYRHITAGILASDLKEGEPCPVCGSLHHPLKAMKIGKAIEKGKRDVTKERLLKAEQKMKKSYESAVEKRAVYEQQRESLKTRLSEPEIQTISGAKPEEKKMVLIQKIDEKKKNLSLLEEKKAQRKLLEQEIESSDKREQKLKKEWESHQSIVRELEKKFHMENGMKQAIEKELTDEFKTLLEAENAKSRISLQKEKLAYKIEESLKEYQKICAKVEAKGGAYLELKKSLESEPNVWTFFDSEEERKKLLELEKEQKENRKNWEFYHTAITVNRRSLALMEKKLKEKKVIEEEYGVVSDVDKVLKGNNPKRIVFEQYVLSVYFEDILTAANERLLLMTGGRYQLFRMSGVEDARTKNNLEIEVLDHYTGKRRSAKTLSGGEAFKASLALSLGTSDVIQRYAGGIEVDALFIDEGFGALDEDSLNQAMDALTTLISKDRMIGIISHVSELKDRIEQQILIEKTPYGSSISLKG